MISTMTLMEPWVYYWMTLVKSFSLSLSKLQFSHLWKKVYSACLTGLSWGSVYKDVHKAFGTVPGTWQMIIESKFLIMMVIYDPLFGLCSWYTEVACSSNSLPSELSRS